MRVGTNIKISLFHFSIDCLDIIFMNNYKKKNNKLLNRFNLKLIFPSNYTTEL